MLEALPRGKATREIEQPQTHTDRHKSEQTSRSYQRNLLGRVALPDGHLLTRCLTLSSLLWTRDAGSLCFLKAHIGHGERGQSPLEFVGKRGGLCERIVKIDLC